jgi:hypothetical protein
MFDTGKVSDVTASPLPTGLSHAVEPASTLIARDDHLLPTAPALRPLLPDGGLRRGTTVNVQGVGETSLVFALLAEASAAGAWCAAVGLDSPGLLAAHHAGVALSRLVLVPDPGPDWPTIVAALLDAFEIVALRPPGRPSARLQQRLAARIRERDRVLVTLGAAASFGMPPDVHLVGTAGVWEGLGWGFGHLRSRQLQVRAEGRRLAGRPRHATVWLPDPDGQVASALSRLRDRPRLAEATA